MTDKHPLAPVLDAIVDALGTIVGVLQDINSTLAAQRTEKGTAPRPSETPPPLPSPSLLECLERDGFTEHVHIKDGGNKVYTAKFLPDKGSTEGIWKAINSILKGYNFEWVSDGKESHWRKK